MDDLACSTELSQASHHLPVLVIIEQEVLPRTCILGILEREFAEFEIMGMATASDLACVSGRDVRLVALITGDKPIVDPSVEQRLKLVEKLCPNVPVALLSSRDDEEAASTAMQRGIRGFFSTAIPIEVACRRGRPW
jgi:DNA-binding NarL/FixJ family response regulator